MKKVLTVLLLLFTAVAAGFIIRDAVRGKADPAGTEKVALTNRSPTIPANSDANNICDPNDNSPCSQTNNPAPVPGQPSQPEAGKPSRKVVVYYFHGNFRCSTCRTIEAYSREAVQTGFSEALKSGLLEWKVVNVEETANRHFIQDYQLYTKSLVLVKMDGDKQLEWKNLGRVWELVKDKPAFVKYVQDEIPGYLGK